MIQANNLSKQFGGQLLFKGVSFNLTKGEKVGLVGRNGAGKSTIFNIILGKISPDEGEISAPKGYRIGQLEQHIVFTKATVLEECVQALPEESKFDFHKAQKILFGLGFEDEDMDRSPQSFSGGYQIRINLCKALLGEPDLLLLDEPTNYLDIVSMRWLTQFLRSFPGELVLITHDRQFMDSVTNHTMGLHRKQLKKIKGDTEKYYQQILLEEEIYEKTRLNQEKKREHLESFVERFRAKASKAVQAQSRMKQLEKMGTIERLEDEASMGLAFRYLECPGKELMRAKELSFAYPGGAPLFENLDLTIGSKERIAIIGKNGKGKSTLLNVLAGELTPASGSLQSHPSLAKGHFGQTNVSRLCNDHTIVQEISLANSDLSQTATRNICGALMFEGELADKKISVLSGGEKNRVMLGRIVATPSNLLLLDEPTNHLDMESIEILGDEIRDYPGAVLMVTHSEALLRKIANRLIVFGRNGAQVFDGGYDEFLEKIGWEEESEGKARNTQAGAGKNLTKKELHALRQDIIKQRSKVCSPLIKEQERLEEQILGLEERLEEGQQLLEEGTKESDNQKILESSRKIGEIEQCIQIAFERMETLENELLEHRKQFDAKLAVLESE